MSNDELDKEELQEELDQIKEAMGLHEQYPYWTRWWLIEGVGIGILFPLIQFVVREPHPIIVLGFLVLAGGVLLVGQIARSRGIAHYERPPTGVPDWEKWQYPAIAGVVALVGALLPVLPALKAVSGTYYMVVTVGSMFGVAYLFMGQLLEAYHIRKSDRYAFYVGGLWLLVLTAVLPNIPALRGWALAVLGIGLAIYHVGAYLYISRR